ncbi:uncharacterized protein C8A04DRAFT_30037 [Dichotomopilus funicola]|uniref:Uncharacterized protein n=1 Tax=Dichotomopilus funicola TaxID=1934379 RepID=A0AAN6V092_9PEZI|nr:hypothetical protein C8A04DRAFT_30037 [Dichotomopilus funicola]
MNTAGAVILAIVLLLLTAGVGWIIFTRIRASRLGLPSPPWKSYFPCLPSSSSPSYGGPSPAPGGFVGWVSDKLRSIGRPRNTRTAAGAYEGGGSSSYNAGYSGGGNNHGGSRGQGHSEYPEDDDPWDSRVGGYNPYEEERELGVVPPASGMGGPGGYVREYRPDGEGYQMNLAVAPGEQAGGSRGLQEEEEQTRGRPRSRSPGHSGAAAAQAQAQSQAHQPAGRNPFDDEAEPSNLSLRGVSPRPMDGGGDRASFAARKAAAEDRRSMFREEV